MEQLVGHDFHHRRALDKRQIRTVITSTVEEPRTTYTTRITTRVPILSAILKPTTTSTVTSARVTSSASSSSRASTSAVSRSASATQRPTASSSSASSTAAASSSVPTSRPTAPTSSSDPAPILTVRVTETIPSTPSASATDLNAVAPAGAKSAGQIAGIIVGIIAGVIGVAIFAAFIVRHMRKRARDKEAWDASKFRNSALLLRDEKGGNGGGAGSGGSLKAGPRPPSMIERRAAAPTGSVLAPSRAYPFTDGTGAAAGYNPQEQLGYNRGPGTPQLPQQYGAPNPYGAAPMPYGGQNMYGQGVDRGYGNGFGGGSAYGHQGMDMHHPGFPSRQNGHESLPPFASYGPPLDMDVNSFGAPAAGAMGRSNSTTSNTNLPNPFSERGPAQGPPSPRDSGSAGRGSGTSTTVASNNARLMTRNVDEDDEQPQGEAPPAYSDDGTYAKMQRDVKSPVVMTVQGTRMPAPAVAPAPVSAATPPKIEAGNNKARPMSTHTVYDATDAYGGI